MAAHRLDEQLIDGRYARVGEIGRGGFGIVWRAHDTLLQRDVAIKEVRFPTVLDDEELADLREKVLQEARAAARLSHPALITVFDVVEEDGRPFIIMELVEAPTLAQRVAEDGPFTDREAAAIGEQVLDALATAHAHGIVHRDVKPANVMVSTSGRVQLGDFGIASIIDDPKVTSSGHLAGSPSYMAPEQAHNRPAGPATDLWGLAATLYFAVEGTPPFEKDGAIPTLTAVVSDTPRATQRAAALAPLLGDLLVKDPAARPPVEEVRRRLGEIAAGTGQPVTEPAAPVPPPTLQIEPEPLEALTVSEAAPASAPPDPDPVAAAPPPRVATRRPPARREGPSGLGLLVGIAAVVVLALVGVLMTRGSTPSTSPQDPGTTEVAGPDGEPGEEAPGERPRSTAGTTATTTATTTPAPGEWVSYQDPATGFTIAHPPGWTIERDGTLTDFRDPASGAYLRVDYTSSPGPSPEQAWLDLEASFAAENPDYRRIRIVPTTFKGYPAAIWEFTYTGRGVPLHAIDLGFVTGPYGFALNFQTRAEDWDEMQDVFEAFQDSFRAPGR